MGIRRKHQILQIGSLIAAAIAAVYGLRDVSATNPRPPGCLPHDRCLPPLQCLAIPPPARGGRSDHAPPRGLALHRLGSGDSLGRLHHSPLACPEHEWMSAILLAATGLLAASVYALRLREFVILGLAPAAMGLLFSLDLAEHTSGFGWPLLTTSALTLGLAHWWRWQGKTLTACCPRSRGAAAALDRRGGILSGSDPAVAHLAERRHRAGRRVAGHRLPPRSRGSALRRIHSRPLRGSLRTGLPRHRVYCPSETLPRWERRQRDQGAGSDRERCCSPISRYRSSPRDSIELLSPSGSDLARFKPATASRRARSACCGSTASSRVTTRFLVIIAIGGRFPTRQWLATGPGMARARPGVSRGQHPLPGEAIRPPTLPSGRAWWRS